jgi:hypothetical protein
MRPISPRVTRAKRSPNRQAPSHPIARGRAGPKLFAHCSANSPRQICAGSGLTLPLNPFDLHLKDDNGAKHGLPFSGLHRLQVPRRFRQKSRFERLEEFVSILRRPTKGGSAVANPPYFITRPWRLSPVRPAPWRACRDRADSRARRAHPRPAFEV